MKTLRNWAALVALTIFVAGAVALEAQPTGWFSHFTNQSSGNVQFRLLSTYGRPVMVGFGDAVPTNANDGAPPMDGELYVVTVSGSAPDLQMYDANGAAWNSIAGLDVNAQTWAAAQTFTSAATFNGDVTIGSDEEDLLTINAPVSQVIFRDDFCGIGAEQTDRTVESGTDNEVNLVYTQQGGPYEYQVQGTQGVLAARNPADGSCGWFMEGDTAAQNDGLTVTFSPNTLQGVHQVTATSDVFYAEFSITIADISALDGAFAFGLKLPESVQDDHDDLDTYVLFTLSDNAGDMALEADNGGGGAAQDDITGVWANGETHVVRFEVDGDGYAVYIDGTAQTTTTINSGGSNDFADLDRVVPFMQLSVGAEQVTSGTVLNYLEYGIGAL